MRKMYHSISEVSKMLNLAPHVLRYWETEFSDLRPKKNRAGSRTYRETDIELLRDIQKLLHEERYTVEGARRELKRRKSGGEAVLEREVAEANQPAMESEKIETSTSTPEVSSKAIPPADLEFIRKELREILDILS